jgi:sec-independent protein translocase protein TatC
VKPIFLFLVRPFTVAEGLKAVQDAGGAHHGSFDLLLALVGLKHVPASALKDITLQATAPLEQFFTNIKLSAFGAIILAFPIIAWQLYRFVAPGLYKKERNAFLPFLIASPLLFLMGASLVYFVMLPFVLWFSLSQQIVGEGVKVVLQTRVSEYLTLVTTLLMAFGLSFQLPVVLSLGGLAGLVDSKMLRERPSLRRRRRLRDRRDRHPAGPDQPDHPRGAAVPALRDLDLVRVADRTPPQEGRRRG